MGNSFYINIRISFILSEILEGLIFGGNVLKDFTSFCFLFGENPGIPGSSTHQSLPFFESRSKVHLYSFELMVV